MFGGPRIDSVGLIPHHHAGSADGGGTVWLSADVVTVASNQPFWDPIATLGVNPQINAIGAYVTGADRNIHSINLNINLEYPVFIFVVPNSPFSLVLKNSSATGTFGYLFTCPSGTDYTVSPGTGVLIVPHINGGTGGSFIAPFMVMPLGAVGAISSLYQKWDAVIIKPGDENRTSTTVLSADGDLQFVTVNNAIYYVEVIGIYTNAAGSAPDIKFDLGEDTNIRGSFGVTGVSSADAAQVAPLLADRSAPVTGGSATGLRPFLITGTFRGGGGTFVLRWAQNTSNATPTVLKAGSLMRYQRII